MSLGQLMLGQALLRRAMLAWVNPFDWRTVVLARHAQHVVLIHFPIALYLAGVALDVAAVWLKREQLADAAHYNFLLAALFVLPAVATGLLAWQWQLEGQKLKGTLLEHLIAGLTATVAILATGILWYRARRRGVAVPQARFVLEAAGVIALMVAGHLGGFVSGVNAAKQNLDSVPTIISVHSIFIRPQTTEAGGGDADEFVSGSVVEKPIVIFASHAFYKHHVGDLAGFFPSELGRENGLIAAVQKFTRIAGIEDGDAGAPSYR